MSGTSPSWLAWQVRRVRRRLFFQHLINATIVAWVSASAIFAVWWLARPYALGDELKPWMDWAVGGGVLALATFIAVIVAVRRAPTPVNAALSLDDRFQLRERVTTSLTLAPELHATDAGKALLADAEAHVSKIDVRSRFPVRFGWRSMLVPASIAALLILGAFYEPMIKTAQGSDSIGGKPLAADVVKELEQKKQEFLQRPKKDAKQEKRMKSEELQKIEAQVQEILKRPMTTTDEVKDRLAELTKLEEEKKKTTKDDEERIQSFKEQLQKLDRLAKKDKDEQDKDQTKELRDALQEGDLEKAKDAADRLSKKIKNDELSKKEKDHLENEMTDLKKDLEQLKDDFQKQLDEKHDENEKQRQEKEKQIEQEKKEGKIDQEEAERRKNEIKKERKKENEQQQQEKKDLENLAKKMGECEKCMKSGDKEGASQALHDASKQLQQMQDKEQETDDMEDELEHLQRLREGICKGCCNGKGGNSEGDAETLSRQENQSKKAGGRRRDRGSLDAPGIDTKEKGAFDKKGAKIQVGTAGQAERVIGKKGVSLEGEIQQAGQDAPDSVDTQRIPRGYKDSTKGYFKNIGGQKTGDSEKPK